MGDPVTPLSGERQPLIRTRRRWALLHAERPYNGGCAKKETVVSRGEFRGITFATRNFRAGNGNCRVDINDVIPTLNPRPYGYIGEIEEGSADNARTPYSIYLFGRVGMWGDFVADGPIWRGPD